MTLGVRTLGHEFWGDKFSSYKWGKWVSSSHVGFACKKQSESQGRVTGKPESQGRVLLSAPPGPTAQSSRALMPQPSTPLGLQINILLKTKHFWPQLELRLPLPTCCPTEHWISPQLGSLSTWMGWLQGWDFQPVGGDTLVHQESFFSRLQPTHVKKIRACSQSSSYCLGEFIHIYSQCMRINVSA